MPPTIAECDKIQRAEKSACRKIRSDTMKDQSTRYSHSTPVDDLHVSPVISGFGSSRDDGSMTRGSVISGPDDSVQAGLLTVFENVVAGPMRDDSFSVFQSEAPKRHWYKARSTKLSMMIEETDSSNGSCSSDTLSSSNPTQQSEITNEGGDSLNGTVSRNPIPDDLIKPKMRQTSTVVSNDATWSHAFSIFSDNAVIPWDLSTWKRTSPNISPDPAEDTASKTKSVMSDSEKRSESQQSCDDNEEGRTLDESEKNDSRRGPAVVSRRVGKRLGQVLKATRKQHRRATQAKHTGLTIAQSSNASVEASSVRSGSTKRRVWGRQAASPEANLQSPQRIASNNSLISGKGLSAEKSITSSSRGVDSISRSTSKLPSRKAQSPNSPFSDRSWTKAKRSLASKIKFSVRSTPAKGSSSDENGGLHAAEERQAPPSVATISIQEAESSKFIRASKTDATEETGHTINLQKIGNPLVILATDDSVFEMESYALTNSMVDEKLSDKSVDDQSTNSDISKEGFSVLAIRDGKKPTFLRAPIHRVLRLEKKIAVKTRPSFRGLKTPEQQGTPQISTACNTSVHADTRPNTGSTQSKDEDLDYKESSLTTKAPISSDEISRQMPEESQQQAHKESVECILRDSSMMSIVKKTVGRLTGASFLDASVSVECNLDGKPRVSGKLFAQTKESPPGTTADEGQEIDSESSYSEPQATVGDSKIHDTRVSPTQDNELFSRVEGRKLLRQKNSGHNDDKVGNAVHRNHRSEARTADQKAQLCRQLANDLKILKRVQKKRRQIRKTKKSASYARDVDRTMKAMMAIHGDGILLDEQRKMERKRWSSKNQVTSRFLCRCDEASLHSF